MSFVLDFKNKSRLYSDQEAFCEANRCIKCDKCNSTLACPANVDVKSFITSIQNQDLSTSINQLKSNNNLSSLCGVLCTEECSKACVLESPIQIKKLELFVNERTRLKLSIDNSLSGLFVAIVGAGPTGLSAALELAKKGANITVYDENLLPGGIFTNLIPNFELSRITINKLLTELEGYSVKILNNVFVDKNKMAELEQFYNYILVCTGTNDIKDIDNINSNIIKVIDASALLRKVTKDIDLSGVPSFYLQGRTVILGDNYLSITTARTCLRLGSDEVVLIIDDSFKENDNLKKAIDEGLLVRYNLDVVSSSYDDKLVKLEFNDNSKILCTNVINGYKQASNRMLNNLNNISNLDVNSSKVFSAGNVIHKMNSIAQAVKEGTDLSKDIENKYRKKS